MSRRSHALALVVLLIAPLVITACSPSSSSPSGSSAASAKTAICNGLSTVNQALTSLAGVNAQTTVGEVKAAQQKVTTALNAIESHNPSGTGELLAQLKSANEQLSAKLEGYPDSAPIGQTSVKAQDLKTKVATAQSKASALTTTLKCPA